MGLDVSVEAYSKAVCDTPSTGITVAMTFRRREGGSQLNVTTLIWFGDVPLREIPCNTVRDKISTKFSSTKGTDSTLEEAKANFLLST